MKIRVLGSGAGGGFPQWNCNCDNCRGFREGTIKAQARTQSSIAITQDEKDWILFNASPDIRQQIMQSPLQPARDKRDTGIRAVVLADSQIDHTTGLLLLREGDELHVYGTEQTYEDLTTHHPILKVLEHYCQVYFNPIALDQTPFIIPGFEDIELLAIPLKSESPPFSPNRGKEVLGSNLGFLITNLTNQKKLFYAPGLGQIDEATKALMALADVILIDGTFWTEDEMITKGVGVKKAHEMGHLAQSEPQGMIDVLKDYENQRKILIHINNTNPILDENSPERKRLEQENIEVSYDGMEIIL